MNSFSWYKLQEVCKYVEQQQKTMLIPSYPAHVPFFSCPEVMAMNRGI